MSAQEKRPSDQGETFSFSTRLEYIVLNIYTHAELVAQFNQNKQVICLVVYTCVCHPSCSL